MVKQQLISIQLYSKLYDWGTADLIFFFDRSWDSKNMFIMWFMPCSGSDRLATVCHQFFGTKSTSPGIRMTRSGRGSSAQGYRIQNCLAITRRSISLKKSVKAMPSTSFLWQSKSDSVWGHIISLIVHETRRICSPWDWCLVPDQACSQQCATNFLEQRAHLRA